MTATTLLADLRAQGIVLTADGDNLHFDAPTGALTPDLLEEMRAHKVDLLKALNGAVQPQDQPEPQPPPATPVPLAQRLKSEIRRARSWADLHHVVDQAQSAFEGGGLSDEETYRLSALAGQEAHVLPEVVPPPHAGKRESTVVTTPRPPGLCPCCGRGDWWSKPPAGERVCATCHPDPQKGARV